MIEDSQRKESMNDDQTEYLSDDDVFGQGGDTGAYLSDDDVFGTTTGSKRSFFGTALDTGVSLSKGVVGTGEALVGLADIATGGYAGKALDTIGYDPKATQETLSSFYSDAQKEANTEVEGAEGFLNKISAVGHNPSTAFHAIAESVPMMIGGAGVARKGLQVGAKLAPKAIQSLGKWAPTLAGAIGEGVVGAGSAAEGTRQETEDKLLTGKQVGLSVASGVGTAAISLAGGALAKKMGFADADTMLASGALGTDKTGIIKRIIGGGISEGVFEEMPQSAQEQVFANAALNKPLFEGVPEAAAMGLVTGAAMGGGVNILPNSRPEKPKDPVIQSLEKVFGNDLRQQAQDKFDEKKPFNMTLEPSNTGEQPSWMGRSNAERIGDYVAGEESGTDDLLNDFANQAYAGQAEQDVKFRQNQFDKLKVATADEVIKNNLAKESNQESLTLNTTGQPATAEESAGIFNQSTNETIINAEKRADRQADLNSAFGGIFESEDALLNSWADDFEAINKVDSTKTAKRVEANRLADQKRQEIAEAKEAGHITDQEAAIFEEKVIATRKAWAKKNVQTGFDKRFPQDEEDITGTETVETEITAEAKKEAETIIRADPRYQLMAKIKRDGGISLEQAKTMFSPETIKGLNQKYPGLLQHDSSARFGSRSVNPDEAAQENGYDSANDMILDIANAPTIKAMTAKLAQDKQAEWAKYEELSQEDIANEPWNTEAEAEKPNPPQDNQPVQPLPDTARNVQPTIQTEKEEYQGVENKNVQLNNEKTGQDLQEKGIQNSNKTPQPKGGFENGNKSAAPEGGDLTSIETSPPAQIKEDATETRKVNKSSGAPEGVDSALTDIQQSVLNKISTTEPTKLMPSEKMVADSMIKSGHVQEIEGRYIAIQDELQPSTPDKVLEPASNQPVSGVEKQGGDVIADPVKVDKIKWDIKEGELILKSGKFNDKKRSKEYLEGVKRQVEKQKKRIGDDSLTVIGDGVKFSKKVKKSTQKKIESLKNKWSKKIETIFVDARDNGDIVLGSLIVGKDKRKSGVGTQFMEELTVLADVEGSRILLSPGLPDDRHGTTSRARLVKFYKRFGFKENKGRNKDFTVSEGMIREPSVKFSKTRNDNFENWFDGSVVVDEDGNPLLVKHGTRAEVTDEFSFDFDKIGDNGRSEGAGFYFTTNDRVASGYGEGGTVLEGYLQIEQPLRYDAEPFDIETVESIVKKLAEVEAKEYEMDIEDGFLSNFGDARYDGIDSVVSEAASLIVDDETALDQIGGMVGSGASPEHVNLAVKEVTGYDGIIAQGFGNSGGDVPIYVAFFPEQFKSVDNVGTWNKNDKRIYHSKSTTKHQDLLNKGLTKSNDTTATDTLQSLIGGKATITPWALPDNTTQGKDERNDNRGTVSRGSFEVAGNLSSIFGKEVVWVTADGIDVNGIAVPKHSTIGDKIFIDVRSEIPSHAILGHELLHHLKEDHPQQYADLAEIIEPLIKGADKYASLRDLDLSKPELNEEIIADLLGDSFTDSSFWLEVAAHSPKKFNKIAAKIRDWINKLIRRVKVKGFGSDAYVTDLKKTRTALSKFIAQTGTTKGRADLSDKAVGVANVLNSKTESNFKAVDVESKAFKEWFSGSKIVDEDRKPLVVYHGTSGDFESFNSSNGGIYFTEKPEHAERFTNRDGGDGGNIVPAYLSVKNLFDTRRDDHREIFEQKFYRKWGNGTPLDDSGLPDWVESHDFEEFFDEEGLDFDGAVVGEPPSLKEDGEYEREFSYMVFSSTQIKSATSNTGQFSPTDPRINYSTTTNLQKFLKNSKVKSTVFHGSQTFGQDDNFTFDDTREGSKTKSPLRGLGFFFTEDRNEAMSYANATGEVQEIHLNVENPLIINSFELPQFNDIAEAKAFQKRKELEGHDGIYLVDEGHWVAFKSNQAKSADKNSGAYDKGKADIRYSVAYDERNPPPTGQATNPFQRDKELISILKNDKKDIYAKQAALTKHIKSSLPKAEQWRVIHHIKNISKPSTEKGRKAKLDIAIQAVEKAHHHHNKVVKDILSEKDIIARRRASVRSIRDYLNLTDAELRKVSRRDIRLMSNREFTQYKTDLYEMALDFGEHKQAKAELMRLIDERRLNKVQNLQKALELPTIAKMTKDQLEEFAGILSGYEVGDTFMGQRSLETVDRVDFLKGIRTWREAKEKLAEKSGTSVEELSKITVSGLDHFRWDSALVEQNPFYELLVKGVTSKTLDANLNYMEIEKKANELSRKSEQSRKRSTIDKLVPQDKQIFEYIESKPSDRQAVADKMTPEQVEFANFIQKYFGEALQHLVENKMLEKGRENYFVHMRRTFLETWRDDGFFKSVKGIFENFEDDQAVFNILDDDTGNILPMEKFFQYSLQRTGQLTPTKNVSRAFLSYAQTFEKKKMLDALIPEMEIYSQALTPESYTETGLEIDKSLKKFVHKYINNKKGRRISFDSTVRQGGGIDLGITAIRTFTTMMDLALNIPVGVASFVGENVSNFAMLGSKNYSKGIARQNTAKGKRFLNKYRGFTGRSAWEEFTDPGKEITERMNFALFGLFHQASVTSNKLYMLGSITDAEYNSGKLSPERLAELQLEMGRFRVVPGTGSLVGSTSTGKLMVQYKSWAVPLIRTTTGDVKKIVKDLKNKPTGEALTSKEAKEIYRIIGVSTTAVLVGMLAGDDEDDSLFGQIKAKAYRESTTLMQGVDPKLWLSTPRVLTFMASLGVNLNNLVMLEEYKTKPGLRGVGGLKKQFTPSVVRKAIGKDTEQQFSYEKKKLKKIADKVKKDPTERAKHIHDLKSYRRSKNVQRRLSSLSKRAKNLRERQESSGGDYTREIDRINRERLRIIKSFLDSIKNK